MPPGRSLSLDWCREGVNPNAALINSEFRKQRRGMSTVGVIGHALTTGLDTRDRHQAPAHVIVSRTDSLTSGGRCRMPDLLYEK